MTVEGWVILRNYLKEVNLIWAYQKYVFANRVVEKWNSISDCCINSTSVSLIYVRHIYLYLELDTRINNVRFC